MTVVVDIADVHVSNDSTASLVTFSLGSCIGVTIWDPEARVGGMVHYMLPDSAVEPARAAECPAMFADTGIPSLFRSAYALGAVRERLVVKVAGGSQLLNECGPVSIGKRNYLALRKIFWKNGVEIDREDVGGSLSRTLRLDVSTGRVTVRTRGAETVL
jgi:chemotaxis protein CheD